MIELTPNETVEARHQAVHSARARRQRIPPVRRRGTPVSTMWRSCSQDLRINFGLAQAGRRS